VAAMLEFDPILPEQTLREERQELLLKNESRIYDTTAWNVTMMFGLDALVLPTDLPKPTEPLPETEAVPDRALPERDSVVALVFDGADDQSVTVAAQLLEQGVQVRAAEKAFEFDKHGFSRGSVLATPLDNREFGGDWFQTTIQTGLKLGLTPAAVRSGLGPGDLPDLGGEHFRRLEPPRIALLSREFSSTDYGSIWFVLDHYLGIRHSNIDAGRRGDLSRYNVLVVPSGGADELTTNGLRRIEEWVKAGGPLIVIGSSTGPVVAKTGGFSKVRRLPDVLDRLPEYEVAVLREWQGLRGLLPDAADTWSHEAKTGLKYPWSAVKGAYPDEKELKRRDAWQALFMPQGTLLASRVNTNHWLTFGCGEMLPVLAGQETPLMAGSPVETAVRYGYLTAVEKEVEGAEAEAAPPTKRDTPEGEKKKEAPRVGWSALPEGTQMHLRMSGLLWPEASHRLANAAWVTRESHGRGQIILFGSQPTFRAYARGTTRVFLNAAVYGPGFGAAQPVRP